MLTDNVFLLDIRNDYSNIRTTTECVPETIIHRRIIEMYKARDDFQQVDLNIRTSKSLSANTRVDIANALQHMKAKGKKLRRMSADIDYVDASVHEFVLLNCLHFEEIQITSNPEEQTFISVGIAMSLRHALTSNQQCIRSLDISCALSEETCEILIDALKDAHSLEIFRLVLMSAGRSSFVSGMLESLTGKPKLKELQLNDANAGISESLSGLLSDTRCNLKELNLGYDWDMTPQFDSVHLRESLCEVRCNSVTKLLFNGVNFENDTLKELPLVFPNLETLSISAREMPKLSFLELPEQKHFRKLKSCYFPCKVLDIEEARRLVEKLPNVVDVPDFKNDPVVEHFLDWTRCGRVLGLENAPTFASLWPLVLERTNHILAEKADRRTNTIYNLLQDYYRMGDADLLIFGEEDEDNEEEDRKEEDGDY
jgi:hypothetical protein